MTYTTQATPSLPFRLISHPIFMTMLPRLQAAMTWYYLTEGQPKGPIDVAELERLFQFGAIRLGTLIWRQGMSGWTSFAEAFQRAAVKCNVWELVGGIGGASRFAGRPVNKALTGTSHPQRRPGGLPGHRRRER